MRRYYLSPIIGDGSIDNPYRAAVQDHGVNHVAVIPTDPTTGVPTSAWALALVNTANHAPLLADNTIDALPEFPLDGKVNAMQSAARNRMQQAMTRRGITLDLNSADGYRDVIRGIGRALQADFDENSFDVGGSD